MPKAGMPVKAAIWRGFTRYLVTPFRKMHWVGTTFLTDGLNLVRYLAPAFLRGKTVATGL